MDRGQKGITIRGNSAQIAFTYQGIRCRETIPLPPTKAAQKELVRMRQAILYEIKMGTFDYGKHFPHSKKAKALRKTCPDHYTIGEGLKDWLQRGQGKWQRSTIRDYESVIFHHLIPEFGNLPISELTAIRVKKWLADLPCKNKRKNNILTPLRQLYEDLYLDEVIDRNPLARVKNLPVKTREPEPFTADEVARILNQLEGQERNLIQFAFWSGLRTSELIALRWQDVDLEHDRIYVRHANVRGHLKGTKTSSGSREVALQPQAREALLNQQTYTGQNSAIVFHDSRKNEPWKNDQAIRKTVWTPALRRAGLKYRNPYQTRHTFASTLLSRGENPLWVAQQMGHKDWGQIRKIYGRWIAPTDSINTKTVANKSSQREHHGRS
ncbi:MAG: tyrosine-type recombinase/integrase [Methylococcus sp.]|nr:tyrosine-type recombinase/integrase [Methylococcus sp.]